MRVKLVVSLLTICFLVTCIQAQSSTNQDQSKTDPTTAQKELETKGLALVEDVVSEAQTLKLPENRAQILASVADLLWTRDEKRARALFAESMNNIAQVMARDADDGTNYSVYNLRQQILRSIARHDPVLAQEFLIATHQPVYGQGPNTVDLDSQLMMQLAAEIARNDPKQALQMAEENLAKGLTQDALSALTGLQQKDKESANKFFDDIVKKAKSTDLSTNLQAMYTVLSLLQVTTRPGSQANPQGQQNAAQTADAASQQIAYNEQTVRDLADYVCRTLINLLSGGFNPMNNNTAGMTYSIFNRIQAYLPAMDKYAPAQAAILRGRVTQLSAGLDDSARTMTEFQLMQQNGASVDAMMDAASKAGPASRSYMYSAIAAKVARDGEIDKARQLINDNVTDPSQRKSALNNLDAMVVAADLQKGKISEARQLIAQAKTDGEKISLLLRMATFLQKNDKKAAGDVLDEAHGLIGNRVDNISDFGIQIQIATAYGQIDAAKGLEAMEPVIDQMNNVVSAEELVDGFQNYQGRGFKDGELTSMGETYNGPTSQIRQIARVLSAMAKTDFDHARTTSDKFTRIDVKVIVHLTIAQTVLTAPTNQQPMVR